MLLTTLFLASLFSVSFAKPIDEHILQKKTATPTPTASGDASVQTPVQRIFVDTDTCTDDQQKQINQAWEDAGKLSLAALGGRLDYDYTIPKTQWLGKDWNWPGFFPFSQDYRLIISNNVGRQSTLHTDNVASGVWMYLSCPKQHEQCTPGTIAASADASRVFWKNHYTIFCPLFFTQDSFSVSLGRVSGDVNEQQVMDNYWGNQGYTFFHETYHYGGTVSQPRTADYCYKAADCWEMALDSHKGTGWAFQTADSYTLEAMAIYAQQYFKTPGPPVPRKYTDALTQLNDPRYNLAANPSNSTPPTEPDDVDTAPAQPTQYYKALDSVPEDLFNTTDNINVQGTNLDPRWKVLVGPPVPTAAPSASASVSGPNPSSCAYTVTSFEGVTSTGYTIQPTIATMCICDKTVEAGINTVTGSGSTSYLVCAVPSKITVSTMGPTAVSTTAAAPTKTVDPNSAACKSCGSDLGASSCAASDPSCLITECQKNSDCTSCGQDCSTYAD